VSRENVERLRHGIEAFNRGDRTAFLALCDPEVENIPPRDWPESEPIRGREAVWDFYIETTSLWDKRSFEYTEIMEVGDDKIVAGLRQEVQGKASGVPVAVAFWQVVTFREGKVARFEFYSDRAAALKAVSLEE
jgi:ketosteroid isomerase-like protein